MSAKRFQVQVGGLVVQDTTGGTPKPFFEAPAITYHDVPEDMMVHFEIMGAAVGKVLAGMGAAKASGGKAAAEAYLTQVLTAIG